MDFSGTGGCSAITATDEAPSDTDYYKDLGQIPLTSVGPDRPELICVKPTPQPPAHKPGDVVPDRFSVSLKPGVNYATHLLWVGDLIKQSEKCESTKSFITLDATAIRIYGGIFGPSVIAAIRKSSDVAVVVAERLLDTPGDPLVSPERGNAKKNATTSMNPDFAKTRKTDINSWGLHRLNTKNMPVKETDAQNRNTLNWEFEFIDSMGAGINVYVVDSGVNDHKDFGGRIKRESGTNLVKGATNPADTSDEGAPVGHGTRVAGVLAGWQTGVAKLATIIPIKVATAQVKATSLEIKEALWHAFTHATSVEKSGVINVSYSMLNDVILETFVEMCVKTGLLHVVNSAGNDGENRCKDRVGPSNMIIVGGVDIKDQRASYSNFGDCVQIWAPADEIMAPTLDTQTFSNFASGTSFAAPHVAGLMALLLAAAPEKKMGHKELRDLVLKAAVHQIVVPDKADKQLLAQMPLA
ncbi:peptidase S8/S53 domain-containing protein [Mycena galopus ATCC 62051]|nr:peptidase S8/S53 domain-containing protein [Mycena galopus ATCC 62051]